MKRSIGIIVHLQDIPCAKTLLLDQRQGMIACRLAREHISLGSCIEYSIEQKRTVLVIHDIDIIAMPSISHSFDVLFVHQVLDICASCIPIRSHTAGIFEHVLYLYEQQSTMIDNINLFKKIFLCKLLALLGLFPEGGSHSHAFFHGLITMPLDKLYTVTKLPKKEQDIEQWLHSCIATHGGQKRLKTLQQHFNYKT